MGEELYDQVLQNEGVACRIYAPVGEHADLLAYLVRRLLENGANSSFVNNIIDESVPVESLLQDPVALVRSWDDKRNSGIPLPAELYRDSSLEAGTRENSMGLDLSDATLLSELGKSMESIWQTMTATKHTGVEPVTNPANVHQLIGGLNYANATDIERALSIVHEGWADWRNKPVTERAALLRELAVALEQHRQELLVLCTKEAGKTIPDGVAEVREAVDFCRYYADRAEELFKRPSDDRSKLESRGVILCISPWNFPIAIFLGQVVAALVTGNTVIAKPAEQTSLVALRVIEIMAEVGFPESAIQLLVSPGKPVGELLVPDERVQGVMFTGSTDVGRWLNQKLAQRTDGNIPLVAETGGQNAMIVDSTALPEQVVDDVIQSGFQSAGQRCSALRVLFLQEDVADNIIDMLKGAMDELSIGDPALLCTDVGPVIDSKALTRLQDHVSTLSTNPKATVLHRCNLSTSCESGYFFAPHLIELDDLKVLEQEVFGPVVHVIRYQSEHLDAVVDQINSTGFGLTLGVHSRIESVAQGITERANAGNIYINRNMIGAIVGVQPFGGCGLSGTGPKAGGPNYLTRLVDDTELTQANDKNLHASEILKPSSACTSLSIKDIQEAKALWNAKTVAQRESIFRCFSKSLVKNPQPVDRNNRFTHWISQQLDALPPKIEKNYVLPGPTGESNQMGTRSRGLLVSLLTDEDCFISNIKRILVSLLAGNAIVWLVSESHRTTAEIFVERLSEAGLYEAVITVDSMSCAERVLSSDPIDGVLINKASAFARSAGVMISEREGALLPLITEVRTDLLLPRLLLEKTVSVDTTAAGGNASLMTMDT